MAQAIVCGIMFVLLAVLLTGRRLLPIVPWALVVLIIATTAVALTRADESGVDVLGDVPAGPPILTRPLLDWGTWLALSPSAIALTMVAVVEGLLISRSYAEKNHYPTSPNRDLFALGLGNIAAGASGSFAVGSSTSRTAAMDQTGSRTQLPSLVLATGTLLPLLFGTALLGIRDLGRLWRLDKFEFARAGIVVAFVLALINLARRAATLAIDVLAKNDDPTASLLEDAPAGALTAPGIIVIRMAVPLFFANGDVFLQATETAINQAQAQDVRHLVIDMEAVTDVDITGAEAFSALRDWLTSSSATLAFSRVRPTARARLERFGILAGEPVYATNRAAIAALSPGNG